MIAKTPLCFPDSAMMKKKDEHPFYPFFSIDGEWMIPGSSIRGPIRSLYEALTSSCFSTLAENYSITNRTTPRNVFLPGILIKEQSGWVLYKAKRYSLYEKSEKDGNERVIIIGEKIFHYGDAINYKTNGNKVESHSITSADYENANGYLYVGEPFSRKKAESVFARIPVGNEVGIFEKVDSEKEDIEKALNNLCDTVEIYQNESINKNLKKDHCGYRGFKKAKSNGVLPIWYKVENGRLYLSMAAIGRKAYTTTVNDMLKVRDNNQEIKIDYNPCKEREKACPACQLFGMANNMAMGGKVRFSDAKCKYGEIDKGVILKELGSPRPGYYPFYSLRGEEFDKKGAMIAGRKFYWHNAMAKDCKDPYKDTESTGRNATMDLMKTGARFTFDVYYNDVNDNQLSALKWVLTLGGNDENHAGCHKIGHGKPLGLGSSKIVITGIEERTIINNYYCLQSLSKEDIEVEESPVLFDADIMDQVRIATEFGYIKDHISYPYVEKSEEYNIKLQENDLASHQWFTANKGKTKTDSQPQVLKKADEDQTLGIYVLQIGEDSGRSSGSRYNSNKNNDRNHKNNKSWEGKNAFAKFDSSSLPKE